MSSGVRSTLGSRHSAVVTASQGSSTAEMMYRITFADRIGGESDAGRPAPRKASRLFSVSQRSKMLIRLGSSGSAACTKSRHPAA